MARPREFDHDDVLDRAVDLFRAKGYEATTMEDLVNHLGLHRGSIYGAFGPRTTCTGRHWIVLRAGSTAD